MSKPDPATETTDKRQHAAIPMLLAVVGSVAGTLVTTAFSSSQNLTFTSSQNLALLGAVLGAAIPPLIAVAGPLTHLRLWGGALIAAGALVVTYVGFTVHDTVSGAAQTTFPDMRQRSTSTSTGSTTSTTTPPSTEEPLAQTCDVAHQLCISYSPRLHCSAASCESGVTVQNTGVQVLRVTDLRLVGDSAGRLGLGGTCHRGDSLNPNAKCSITVLVKQGPAEHAQLRIGQNLPGGPTIVEIDVDGSTTTTTRTTSSSTGTGPPSS